MKTVYQRFVVETAEHTELEFWRLKIAYKLLQSVVGLDECHRTYSVVDRVRVSAYGQILG